jgi:hypothetical protein
MTLDEWHHGLATMPATSMQIGAIHGEFRRLGFGEDERVERLAISADLLHLGELASTSDLTMGDAGRLVRLLRSYQDRAELAAMLIRPEGQAEDVAGRGCRVSLSDAVAALVLALYGDGDFGEKGAQLG